MADNVAITAGSGTNIATDEVTGTLEHVQLMKIAISTDGSRTLIPADAANGIDVDVTRVSGQVQVGDGTNAIAIDTAPADGELNTVNALQSMSRTMMFNGTTWDRARGDTTNGLDVDVTRVQGTVTVSGTVTANAGTGTLAVSGPLTDTQLRATAVPVSGSGSFTVAQGTAANLQATATLAAGTAYAGRVRLTDGTNDLSVDTVHGDGESATENHLDVAAKVMGLNNAGTFDIIRANVSVNKNATYVAAQTGTALWTPAAGKAVVVTAVQIQSYGTTAGTAILWFGGAADTTFTRGTDAAVFDGEFAPSATNKPGVVMTFPHPVRGTADFVLRVTTTNAQSITFNVWGYEI